jgi:hypothetical protein
MRDQAKAGWSKKIKRAPYKELKTAKTTLRANKECPEIPRGPPKVPRREIVIFGLVVN